MGRRHRLTVADVVADEREGRDLRQELVRQRRELLVSHRAEVMCYPRGRRRQSAPGRWRNTLKIGRSVAGTHTVRRPFARALMVASATAAGVVANGASFEPVVIFEWTNPGRTTSTLAPVPASASPRPCAKPSSPAFGEP